MSSWNIVQNSLSLEKQWANPLLILQVPKFQSASQLHQHIVGTHNFFQIHLLSCTIVSLLESTYLLIRISTMASQTWCTITYVLSSFCNPKNMTTATVISVLVAKCHIGITILFSVLTACLCLVSCFSIYTLLCNSLYRYFKRVWPILKFCLHYTFYVIKSYNTSFPPTITYLFTPYRIAGNFRGRFLRLSLIERFYELNFANLLYT